MPRLGGCWRNWHWTCLCARTAKAAQLLREALEVIVQSADQGGGQIIVVDADNAGLVDWYKRHGFRSTDDRDLRLYMKVATARRYLLGD